MLPGGHRRGHLFRMKIGRSLNHHRVQLLFQQSAVSRKPSVTVLGIDLEFLANFVDPILEVIRSRHHIVAPVLVEQVDDPLSAPAAADQADIDL